MRPTNHWTPRYIFARTAQICYQKICPDHPWLTWKANWMLKNLLRPDDVGLEFGSGRSTMWFARHLGHLTSVENHEGWHKKVQGMLSSANIHNVNYVYAPTPEGENPADSAYVRVLDTIEDRSLDFILVDGAHRGACAREAVKKIRPGGVFVIDNVNWFLPSDTLSPQSRSMADGPADADWAAFLESVENWRRIWTSDDVIDTVLYFPREERN